MKTINADPQTSTDQTSHASNHSHHGHHHHSASYDADRVKILTRLRRIEGQVRGVHKMVEEEKYCVDILTQISAIVAGLRATGLVILEDHIRGCVLSAEEEDEQEALLDELMGAIERFNRSVG